MNDRRLPVSLGWAIAACAGAAFVALALAPPFLSPEAGGWVRHAFSAVCHQIPSRTPHIDGGAIALCHRCTGIAVGFAVGLLLVPLLGADRQRATARSAQGRWLLIAVVPTALDWLVGAVGLWTNTPLSRTLTGSVFGLVAGGILAVNLLAPSWWRRSPSILASP